MYVCVCLAVTDSEVTNAIENGAHTREAVTRACRAGGDCGACHGMIENMVEDHLEDLACAGRPGLRTGDSDTQLIPDSALVRTRAA